VRRKGLEPSPSAQIALALPLSYLRDGSLVRQGIVPFVETITRIVIV
jgi:hypothetical protein